MELIKLSNKQVKRFKTQYGTCFDVHMLDLIKYNYLCTSKYKLFEKIEGNQEA